tara:strand:+ start:2973 stop:3746 length:774 start_codon:yes stop_codon:yes gene_type:complete
MNIFRTTFFLLFLLGVSTNLLAWGQTGHRAVGQVAENHLTKKAKKNIKKLLGNESLALASTWMDEIKSDSTYDYANEWHWVTIGDGETYAESEKNPNGDVVEAIERMKQILKSDTASNQNKVRALKFLAHLVGDIHQPLHVGRGDDRGGNNLKVKWFRSSSNLHRVWDSEIIDDKQLSYTELALAVDNATDAEIKKWQQGSAADWAHEAMTYREQVYKTKDPDNMSYEYMYHNWGLMQDQIQKAGIRLAGILNEIYG